MPTPLTSAGLALGVALALVLDAGAGAHPAQPASGPGLYAIGLDGKGRRKLTATATPARSPAPSPDGRQLAFVRGSELWVLPLDVSRPRRVTVIRDHSLGTPRWSDDGGTIGFASVGARAGEENPNRFHLVGADGARLRSFPVGRHPDWAPRTDRIVFEDAFAGAGRDPAAVSVLDVVAGEVRTVVAGGTIRFPVWSPDGRAIAFEWLREREPEIFVVDVDGRGLRRLAAGRQPVWSPRGDRLAFSRGPAGCVPEVECGPDLFAVSVGTAAVTQLTRHPGPDGAAAWSPDGRRIAFVSRRPGRRGLQIYVIRLEDGHTRRLTDERHGVPFAPPAWSRDGRRLYFTLGE